MKWLLWLLWGCVAVAVFTVSYLFFTAIEVYEQWKKDD